MSRDGLLGRSHASREAGKVMAQGIECRSWISYRGIDWKMEYREDEAELIAPWLEESPAAGD